MRFSSTRELPSSEWVHTPEDVSALAELIDRYDQPIGHDTETDGLGYTYLHSRTKAGTPKYKQAGDGLGAECQVICLYLDGRRIAVPTWGPYRENLLKIGLACHRQQHLLVNYNAIFDYNVLEYNLAQEGHPVEFTDMWCDGILLWRLWDEDAEHTQGDRSLKARTRFWTSLPMNKFDDTLIKMGGVRYGLEDPSLFHKTLDYCTRDAFAHYRIGMLGRKIAERLEWAPECPECGRACPESSDFYRGSTSKWRCPEHGWSDIQQGRMLTMWDYHVRDEIPFQLVLKRMEQRGLYVNVDLLRSYEGPMQAAIDHWRQAFQSAIGKALVERGGKPWTVNPNSSRDLQTLFYGDKDENGEVVGLGYDPAGRTESGGLAVNKSALNKLVTRGASGVAELLELRKIEKTYSTYVLALPRLVWPHTGRLHPTLRDTTTTSRLRSRNPNGQNLPAGAIWVEIPAESDVFDFEEVSAMTGVPVKELRSQYEAMGISMEPETVNVEIRRAIEAEEGFLLTCSDYAQLEVRLVAIESRDKNLIRVINEGRDMHCFTASLAYGRTLPDLTYEKIYDAKQASDGDLIPRFSRLQMLADDEDSFASIFNSSRDSGDLAIPAPRVDSFRNEALVAGRSILHALSTKNFDGFGADTFAWVQDHMADELEVYLAACGFQDKRLKMYRANSKSAIFGILYGIGPTGLAAQITMNSKGAVVCTVEEARVLIDNILNEAYPRVGRYMQMLSKHLKERGYVRFRSGLYRTPMNVRSGDRAKVARAQRQTKNAPIQGLAAWIMKNVMVEIEHDEEYRDLGGKLLLQVHDELLGVGPEENASRLLERKIEIMETMHGLDSPVPLPCSGSIGKTWADAK